MQVTDIGKESAASPTVKAVRGAVPRRAFSITESCLAYNISRSSFYRLRRQGLAPRQIGFGKRTMITVAAAEEWERRLEQTASLNEYA